MYNSYIKVNRTLSTCTLQMTFRFMKQHFCFVLSFKICRQYLMQHHSEHVVDVQMFNYVSRHQVIYVYAV